MPLKLSLKPHEKLFIGGAVVQNDAHPVELTILNDVPLLRERDVLKEDEVDTVCKHIYLCVQLMYMDPGHLANYQQQYAALLDDVIQAAPSTVNYLAEINNHLACGRYYQALKSARKLVEYEQELLSHAQQAR